MGFTARPRVFYEKIDVPRGTFTLVECLHVDPDVILVKKNLYGPQGEFRADRFSLEEYVELKGLRPLPPAQISGFNLRELVQGRKVNVLISGQYVVGTVESRKGGDVYVKVHGGNGKARSFSSNLLRRHLHFHNTSENFSVV